MYRKYRGAKIEYGPDECAQPYELDQQIRLQVPRREAPPPRKSSNLSNRFQLLNVDGEDSQDEDEVAAPFPANNGVGIRT